MNQIVLALGYFLHACPAKLTNDNRKFQEMNEQVFFHEYSNDNSKFQEMINENVLFNIPT